MITFLVLLVAVLHFLFMAAEVFAWPFIAERVGFSPEVALATKPIGTNQGLYNGFLATGLIYATCSSSNLETATAFQSFFLICVAVAGVVGFITLKRIMFLLIQTLPAATALAAIWWPST